MSEPRTRIRKTKRYTYKGTLKATDHSLGPPYTQIGSASEVTVKYELKPGTQVTVSEGHPFHSRKKGDVKDLGGDFSTTRSYAVGAGRPPTTFDYEKASGGYLRRGHFHGHILPKNPASMPYPTDVSSSESELTSLGATAIARCKPTNSVADVASALGEIIKDGLPSLIGHTTWQERTSVARKGGKEFLNAEFGWLPLKNDVEKFLKAVNRADAVLKQYERDAGKVVRRRYNFPVHKERYDEIVGTNQVGFLQPASIDMIATGTPLGTVTRTVEIERRRWFSGAFTYALPSGYDSRNAMQRYALMADVVYGASPSPDTLWELSPWSWAVDWVSNTGDVISNITDWAQHGLVMRYGYIMEHSIVKHTYSIDKSGYKSNKIVVPPLTLVTETKLRRRANPFGFGITWDGLSPLQVAIAGAIGITR